MTVNEMHIAVNLGVQKIASFQVDNLLPEEIDHELNLAMMRFVKQRYNPMSNRMGKGFEQSQKRIDDLRHLVVQAPRTSFQVFSGPVYNANKGPIYQDRVKLPDDYLFLVSARANTQYLCDGNIINNILNNTSLKAFIKIDLTPPAPGYFLTGVSVVIGSVWYSITNTPLGEEITREQLLNDDTYLLNWKAQISKEDLSSSVNNPFNSVEETPVANPNELYLTATYGPSQLSGNYARLTWVNSSGMASAIYTYSTSVFQTFRVSRTYNGDQGIFTAKHAQYDDVFKMLDDPFNTTKYNLPIYTFQEDTLDFYTDVSFVVSYAILNYIRRPKPISLSLGQGCELAEHTHPEIVEMTIKSILEGIQDPRYQSQSLENLESE